MAVINSVTMGKARGSLGNVTLRLYGGDTIASQKVMKGVQRLGTLSQVLRRVRLANLVNAFQALSGVGDGNGMAQSFPSRGRRVSNFNMFVSRNINRANVGDISLSSGEAASGYIVPAPFVVSEGDLPGVTFGVVPAIDENLSPDFAFVIGGTGEVAFWGALGRTPAQFSSYLVSRFGLMDGDVITVFGMEWTASKDDAKFGSHQFVIDSASTASWESLGYEETLSGSNSFPHVKVLNGGHFVSLAVVVGRAASGRYRVSSSAFVATTEMLSAVSAHSSLAAKTAAAASYGYKDDPYLQDSSNPL